MSFTDPSRHLLALASGIVGGLIPNKKSNIHPMVMGATFALFFVKVLLGDLDPGFHFTLRDIVFLVVFASEGALGAWLAQKTL